MSYLNALIVVNVQKDFCPGGAVAVPKGDEIVPIINRLIKKVGRTWRIFFVKDWHPPETPNFEKWPTHCIQFTPGAALHPDLLGSAGLDFLKGMEADGHSAFKATTFSGVENGEITLYDALVWDGVKKVWVCGLSLEQDVKATAIDFAKAGFDTHILMDACRARAAKPEDATEALSEMVDNNVGIAVTDRFFRQPSGPVDQPEPAVAE